MTATADITERAVVARSLAEWAESAGVDRSELERLFDGISGVGADERRAELQDCFYLFPGLRASAWHDPADHPWVRLIEQAYPDIKAEFQAQRQDGLRTHPESADLAAAGSWNTYHFFNMAKRFDDHLAACPRTAAVLDQLPGTHSAGMAYFSVMAPGTRVKPHCGFVNARIRCHLALEVPEDCWMRVGDETRAWSEGRCFVFDDSFEHEVHIGEHGHRAVLLLDTWHPDLTEVEQRGLTHLMSTWRELFS